MYTHTVTNQDAKPGPHMGWPGGYSAGLLANIVIFSSYLILLISKHFTDCSGTEQSLFVRGSCILIREVSVNSAQQCCKNFFSLFSFVQHSNQSNSRKGTQNTRRFWTGKQGMAVIARDKDHLHLTPIYTSETLPLSVCGLQRGSSRTRRQDHQLVSYFERLHVAL